MKAELAAHCHGAAAEALERLRALGGASDVEHGLRELLAAATSQPPTDAAAHLERLEDAIAPLAARHLGSNARSYLAPQWQALAKRLKKRSFDPATPKLHASYASSRANDWREVIKAVESASGWERHEALLLRAAEAYARLGNREAARGAWTRLCWHHAATAARTLATAPGDPQLARRWREFADCDPELPPQDFPAWLLIADLKQRDYVPADVANADPTGTAYAAMHRLLERPDDIENLLGHFLSRRKP